MKDWPSFFSEWGTMFVICFACGALVYQEHVRSCSQQIPSVENIGNYVGGALKRCRSFFSVSNWPLLVFVSIPYVTTVYFFQNLVVAVGGFFTSTLLYHLIGVCMKKRFKVRKLDIQEQSYTYVRYS